MKLAATAAALCSVLLVAGCGSGDDPAEDPPAVPSVSSAATATTPATGTPAPAGSGTGEQPSGGKAFADPDGAYTMTIGKKWVTVPQAPAKAEAWYINTPDGDFRPNVNVYTEALTGPAVGIDLQTYLKISAVNLEKSKLKVVKQTTVAGANSPGLGVIEYTGDPQGGSAMRHFLAIIDLGQNEAAVVTLSTAMETFTQHRKAALPYILTVKAQ